MKSTFWTKNSSAEYSIVSDRRHYVVQQISRTYLSCITETLILIEQHLHDSTYRVSKIVKLIEAENRNGTCQEWQKGTAGILIEVTTIYRLLLDSMGIYKQ